MIYYSNDSNIAKGDSRGVLDIHGCSLLSKELLSKEVAILRTNTFNITRVLLLLME